MLLCCWCISLIAYAQNFNFIPSDYHDYYFQPQNIGISTPQVADFQRYGNLNIDHYNGLLNMEIPLDGYKDVDFDLPLSVKYVSQGFIPSKRPSIVGLNWFLNFGGIITRTVKGSPDDTRGNYVTDIRKYMKNGLLVAMRDGTYVQYSDADLANFNLPLNSSFYARGDFKHDFEPDIFSFNFGGHQGSFIIGKKGQPICISGGGYKIDISGLSIQSYNTTAAPVESTIKITTPDGYIYQFGGNTNYLEYNIPNNPDKIKENPRTILSWYLKTIKSPNNREVAFTYESKFLPNHYNYYMHSENLQITQSVLGSSSGYVDNSSEKIEVKDKVYSPVISKVTIDNAEIRFTYQSFAPFFDVGDPSFCITNISLYYNSKKLKETALTYNTVGKYVLLSSLRKNGENYKFYTNLPKAPLPLTNSIDHWGVWKDVPSIDNETVKNYCENIDSFREPSAYGASVGLLWKVIYPTGGVTEITYEKNSYNRYLEKSSDSFLLNLQSLTESCLGGGSRVKKIVDYDPASNKNYHARNFEYIVPETGKGSGIIYLKPKYTLLEQFIYTYDTYGVFNYVKDISSNSIGFRENYPEYHIGYSDVIERFSDGGYIHYQYTSHADLPNSMSGFTFKSDDDFIWSDLSDPGLYEKIGLYISSDLSQFRGKLKTKRSYNASGGIEQIEEYSYNIADAKKLYQTALASAQRGFASYRIYTTPCLLTSRKITDKNSLCVTETYTYNSNYFLSKKEIVNSNNLRYALNYRYPVDYSYSSLSLPVRSMVDKNMLTNPLTILKSVEGGPSGITDGVKMEYKIENGLPVIDKVKELYTSGPVSEASTAFTNGFSERIVYEKYDTYGNPLYSIKDGVSSTVYLWGYKGRYILAIIVNATYSDVQTKVQQLSLDINKLNTEAIPSQSDLDKLEQLRKLLPQAQITTYKYDPLIGTRSITDPRGFTTYYDYDEFSRLKEESIRNSNSKEILKLYEYNYINK